MRGKQAGGCLAPARKGTGRPLCTAPPGAASCRLQEVGQGRSSRGKSTVSGSKREFVQRLGRILRKKDDKKAILYEIVSGSTNEVDTSYRRHKALHAGEVER